MIPKGITFIPHLDIKIKWHYKILLHSEVRPLESKVSSKEGYPNLQRMKLFEESLKSKSTAKGHQNRSRVDGSRRYKMDVLWIRNKSKSRVRVIFQITVKQICNARGKEAPQSTNSAETRGDGDIRKESERVRQLLKKVINVIEFRVTRKKIIGTTHFHVSQSWKPHIMHNIQSSIKSDLHKPFHQQPLQPAIFWYNGSVSQERIAIRLCHFGPTNLRFPIWSG